MLKFVFYPSFLLLFRSFGFAQNVDCWLRVKIDNFHNPATGILSIGEKNDTIKFGNGKLKINKEILYPVFSLLKINYVNSARRTDWFPVFLQAGHILINISNPDSSFSIKVAGPNFTNDYQLKLHEPVKYYNQMIDSFTVAYWDARKRLLPDTSRFEALYNEAQRKCFDVPRQYIKSNPTSPVSIQALIMMGDGDPTIPNGGIELHDLFSSLSDEIKNSAAAKKYAARWK